MKEMQINKFIEDLGSDSQAPGGGAVAALAGSLGAALTSMVYSLTVGKKVYNELGDDDKERLNKNFEGAKKLYDEMLDYMEKDEKAFTSLMNCYKMPKNTEEEKRERLELIKKYTIDSMSVPLELARISIKLYENIEFAAKKGNKNLISDAAIAAIMLHASIESAIINVEINLKGLNEDTVKESINKEIEVIRQKSDNFKKEILNYTTEYIK